MASPYAFNNRFHRQWDPARHDPRVTPRDYTPSGQQSLAWPRLNNIGDLNVTDQPSLYHWWKDIAATLPFVSYNSDGSLKIEVGDTGFRAGKDGYNLLPRQTGDPEYDQEVAELYNINQMNQRDDPAANWRWVSYYYPKDGVISNFFQDVFSFTGIIENQSDTYWIHPHYIEEVTIPFRVLATNSWRVRNRQRKTPSFADHNQIAMTLYDDVQMRSLRGLIAWHESVSSTTTGLYSLPGAYKRAFLFALVNSQHIPQLLMYVFGTWPSNVSDLTLTGEEGDRIRINVTFEVDWVQYRVPNFFHDTIAGGKIL